MIFQQFLGGSSYFIIPRSSDRTSDRTSDRSKPAKCSSPRRGRKNFFLFISCLARVSRKRRNSGEMASDALWIISFKCVVKGYQDCRFDVKEGEDFRVLKKIGEKGRAFRIVNERGQLGHLQRELVSCLWPVNASILSRLDWRLVTGLVTEVSQLNARARAGEERIFFFLFLVWPYNKQLINRATV